MSLSMKYLFTVAVVVGVFEALSAVWFNAPDVAGQVAAGVVAVILLACAWAMRARRSVAAASVIGVLLVIGVGGIPFYNRASWEDWAIQLGYGVVCVLGIIAWVNVLRSRRPDRAAA